MDRQCLTRRSEDHHAINRHHEEGSLFVKGEGRPSFPALQGIEQEADLKRCGRAEFVPGGQKHPALFLQAAHHTLPPLDVLGSVELATEVAGFLEAADSVAYILKPRLKRRALSFSFCHCQSAPALCDCLEDLVVKVHRREPLGELPHRLAVGPRDVDGGLAGASPSDSEASAPVLVPVPGSYHRVAALCAPCDPAQQVFRGSAGACFPTEPPELFRSRLEPR